MEPIGFVISIPIRDVELEDIKAAFVSKRPFGAPLPTATVLDNAGNEIPNPVTIENYIEDCIGYYVLETTKAYLVDKASKTARNNETITVNDIAADLASWIRS